MVNHQATYIHDNKLSPAKKISTLTQQYISLCDPPHPPGVKVWGRHLVSACSQAPGLSAPTLLDSTPCLFKQGIGHPAGCRRQADAKVLAKDWHGFHNSRHIYIMYNNYLITESEVVTGKSQTEALPYWPSDSEVNTVGRGLRFSRNDRTGDVIKLFIIWLTVWIKEKKLFQRKSSIYCDARVYRFIHRLKPRTKLSTQSSVNFTTGKHISVREKEKVLQNSPNKRWKKIPMLQNGLLRITRSSHSLSTISLYLRVLHFGRSMNELFKPCERLKLPVVIKNCRRGKPPDCLRLMILKAVLHLLVLKRGNLFDENY